ncbi:MAG: PilZ domain-containing protein [Pyrinomonadaceae bacterium]
MPTLGLRSPSERSDRRAKPRICVPFPAKVEGRDKNGEDFKVQTVLDNLSADGLYLRMVPYVEPGTKISILLKLVTTADLVEAVPRFAIDGVVIRSEEKIGGARGVAVTFDRVRFL